MVMNRFKCGLTQKVFSYLTVTYYHLLIKLYSVLLTKAKRNMFKLVAFFFLW